MIGLHNKNALAAISVAVDVDVTKVIKEGVQEFSVQKKINLIYRNKIRTFDDYAHHPVNYDVKNLKLISKKRIIAIHEP